MLEQPLRKTTIYSFSLTCNTPLAHGGSASRTDTWSDAVSTRPRASARPHMTRHHHSPGGTLFRTLPPRFTGPTRSSVRSAYLSFESNLPSSHRDPAAWP